ncbi:MAG TPA: hypothetical protein VGG87_06590 [Solirubrobacteraceae bacterium]
MRTLVNAPAFDFDELRFDWGDVVLAAVGWGDWQELERSLAEGLAWASELEDRRGPVDASELHAAVVRFRRARGLLAGDDYLRWLSERSLSPEDVRAHFVRATRRERADEGKPPPVESRGSEMNLLEASIRAEAILSGRLQLWARRLVRAAAASRGLHAAGVQPPVASDDAVATLLAAARGSRATGLSEAEARARAPRAVALLAAELAFRDHVVTRERLERCLAGHQLDWQRFVWEEATFTAEGPAREASLWVREDGVALGEVAALAHASTHVRAAYAEDVPELSGRLAAAAPGEVIGPFAGAGAWRLICMRERTTPAVNDGALRQRASAEVVEHALDRHLAGRVTWHVEY